MQREAERCKEIQRVIQRDTEVGREIGHNTLREHQPDRKINHINDKIPYHHQP
jgi:hypothetical protein